MEQKQLYTFLIALSMIAVTAYFFNNPQFSIIPKLANLHLGRIETNMKIKSEDTEVEQDVILVNIGNMSRMGIALEVEKILAGKPKVLGVDVCFVSTYKTQFDSILENQLRQSDNIILYTSNVNCDFASGIPHLRSAIIRDNDNYVYQFKPSTKNLPSFEEAIAEFFNKDQYNKFKTRKNEYEIINFIGNEDKFNIYDVADVLSEDFDASIFQDKIILLGYLGQTIKDVQLADITAKYYTPINKHLNTLSGLPDMFEVVLSANIISSIINGRYINTMPVYLRWIPYLLFILLVYFLSKKINEYNFFISWFGNIFLFITIFFIDNYTSSLMLFYFNFLVSNEYVPLLTILTMIMTFMLRSYRNRKLIDLD